MKPHNPLYYRWKGKLLHSGIHILSHMRLLIRWTFFSVFTGSIMGLIGVAFVYCIQSVTTLRTNFVWMPLTLPLGGLLIVWLYRIPRRSCRFRWHL